MPKRLRMKMLTFPLTPYMNVDRGPSCSRNGDITMIIVWTRWVDQKKTSKACLLRFSPSTFKLEIRMLLCSGCRKDTSRRRVLWSVLGEGRGKVRVTFLPVLFIQLKIFNTRRAIQHKIFIHQGPHWGSYVLNPFTPNSAPFLWCKT